LALARWLNLSKWWEVAALGAAAGLLASLIFPLRPWNMPPWDEIAVTLMFLIAGVFAGIAAWRERAKGKQFA
jgi:hypothetical protein